VDAQWVIELKNLKGRKTYCKNDEVLEDICVKRREAYWPDKAVVQQRQNIRRTRRAECKLKAGGKKEMTCRQYLLFCMLSRYTANCVVEEQPQARSLRLPAKR
jgi:hypothetical protein